MHYTLGHSRTRVVVRLKSVFLLPTMKKDEEEWSQKRGKKNKILNSYWRNVCAD